MILIIIALIWPLVRDFRFEESVDKRCERGAGTKEKSTKHSYVWLKIIK